ncbi:glycosyltransferase family 2 protein [Patescibacteria group bacterium]|nr:glycosyltransferase family 2 protein [Patescibacteria group bacterium]
MISAVVLTKNEEKNIVDCFETLLWCDEIVVIDDYSKDRTIEIIQNQESRIKIYRRHLAGDFSAQRNFGLDKARGDWIIFVDADERVPSSLREEIVQLAANPISRFDGFYIQRRDFMWGRQLRHGETGNIKLLRLAKKNAGRWEGKVHEEWRIRGRIGRLENPLLHYPHQTISEFLKEINFYTDLRSQELYTIGIHGYWLSVIFYPLGKFFLNYFFKMGFLDGLPGFVFSVFMSFHSFLVRGKLWTIYHKKEVR